MSPAPLALGPGAPRDAGEAIDIFRTLWDGGVHTTRGKHFTVDHARLYEKPPGPIPIWLGIAAPAAWRSPWRKPTAYGHRSGQDPGGRLPRQGRRQAALLRGHPGHGPDEAVGLKMARDRFRFGALTWPAMSEIPTVEGFEAASAFVRPEDMAGAVGAGPDPEKHLAAIRRYADAGFDHICLLGSGPTRPASSSSSSGAEAEARRLQLGRQDTRSGRLANPRRVLFNRTNRLSGEVRCAPPVRRRREARSRLPGGRPSGRRSWWMP